MTANASQRGVLKGIITGAIFSVGALSLIVFWSPGALIPDQELPHRIAFALGWDVALLICLVVSIGMLARHRFFTPEDIDGGGLTKGTPQAILLQSILQNTLEQVVIAFIAHLAWSAIMPLDWQAAIPIAVGLFVIGRILFFRGYSGGAPARALGFALTFYPTVLMVIAMAITLLV